MASYLPLPTLKTTPPPLKPYKPHSLIRYLGLPGIAIAGFGNSRIGCGGNVEVSL